MVTDDSTTIVVPLDHEKSKWLRRFSWLVSDNVNNDGIRIQYPLISLYPLHRRQILAYIQSASLVELSGLNLDLGEQLDDEFWTVFKQAVEKLVHAIRNQEDIQHLWSLIRILAQYDRNYAVGLAQIVWEKVSRGEIAGERAKSFAIYLGDWALEGGQGYLTTRSDDELVAIYSGEQYDSARRDVLGELFRRNHPLAESLLERSVDQLMTANYYTIREIYVQKLIKADFSSWVDGLKVNDPDFLKQVIFSVDAASRKVFDSTNQTFVDAIVGLDDKEFFEIIESILIANLKLDSTLHFEAKNRVVRLLSNLSRLDQVESFVRVDKYVDYLCRIDPELAQELWIKNLPVVKEFLDKNNGTFCAGIFLKSLMVGFAPLIIQDFSKLNELSSESSQASKWWQEIRTRIFWALVLLDPRQIRKIAAEYFANDGYLKDINVILGKFVTDLRENERNELLKSPQVVHQLADISLSIKIGGDNPTQALMLMVAQLLELDDLQRYLNQIDYSIEEAHFVAYFMADLVNGKTEEVKAKLERFRQLQVQFEQARATANPKPQDDQVPEKLFWIMVQVWVAILIDIAPSTLEMIIEDSAGQQHSYSDLRDKLRIYGQLAYTSRNPQFVHSVYVLSQEGVSEKIWMAIFSNFDFRKVIKMSEDELRALVVVAEEWAI